MVGIGKKEGLQVISDKTPDHVVSRLHPFLCLALRADLGSLLHICVVIMTLKRRARRTRKEDLTYCAVSSLASSLLGGIGSLVKVARVRPARI